MNHLKKIIAALLCSVVISAPMAAMNVQAATFAEINVDKVFINQKTDYTCTLVSNVMMLRRAAILLGDPNWMDITEDKCRYDSSVSSGMWTGGMVWDYVFYGTTKNVTVSNPRVDQLTNDTSNSGRKKLFIDILKKHPEGVVIYSYSNPMHAILLTDYDAQTDTFYCSDPNKGTPTKRVPMSQSNVNIYNVTSIWWIVSPELHFTSGSTATSGSAQTKQEVVQGLDETWVVTDDWGVNLRANAGVTYDKIGYVPYHATVKVTKRKVSGGYNWGYVNYESKNGWIALDYATKIEEPKSTPKREPKTENIAVLENVSSISAEEIVSGERITLKGAAQKGTAPYTYAYFYRKSYNNTWTKVKDFSDSKSETIEPTAAAEYEVCIKVKDAKGNVEKKYMTFHVRKPLKNKSYVTSSVVYSGDEVQLKGKASGGIGTYSYAYFYRKTGDADWTKLKDFSEDTTAVFKPSKVTDYEICIEVKDEKGHIEKVYKTVEVCPKLVNRSGISSENITLGDTVKMTAYAEGGKGGYQYAFYYKRAENENWVTAKGFGDDNTAELKPVKDTTYEVCIKVRDFYGRVEKKYFNISVTK